MTEASGDKDLSAEQDKIGPDYFGYYTREVAYLLSQAEGYFPCASETFDLADKNRGIFSKMDSSKHIYTGKEGCSSGISALFCNALGASISDFKKERLSALLRQCAPLLTQEVKEVSFLLSICFFICKTKLYCMHYRFSKRHFSFFRICYTMV